MGTALLPMHMRVTIATLLLISCIPVSALAASGDFTLCDGRYALCTTAKCTPVPGQPDTVSCACDVKNGYSVGKQACQDAKASGDLVKSRYFPVKYHAICSNNRPWAWCLDKPCTVDKNDPAKATCACTTVKDQGDYVIVTKTYSQSTCTTGIVSSATVEQSAEITDFLKTQQKLQPFPIKIVGSENK